MGPLTQARIAELTAATTPSTPQTPTTPTTPSTPSSSNQTTSPYTRDLFTGSRGSDVTQLQTFLIQQGYLESGYATGYFGTLTQSALIKFQQANNITPAIGYFGAKTRGVVGK
jgi:peptidoglycan hydrolase-like protein with peptidoglycan-binding domain